MASDVATAGEAGAEVTGLVAGQANNGDQGGPAASETVTPAASARAGNPNPPHRRFRPLFRAFQRDRRQSSPQS